MTENFEDTATGQLLRSVKAFAAELEREKIAERTTRGKTGRARSGRLPQGTGKGCYGYIYNPTSGKRDAHPVQALAVERIFRRYTETRSFSAVSQELNTAGIPALGGGRWYPLTVRSILTNETYAGHTVYRKTQRVAARTGRPGKRHSRVVERPQAEWLVLEGASPRLIDQQLWERVQRTIEDPERVKRQPTGRFYLLSGRLPVACAAQP